MLLIDPESGAIVDANSAAEKYYGYALAHLVGMSIDRINVMPKDQVAAERQRALREERNYFLFRHRLASGELRDVEVYATPVESKGRMLLFSIVHDIAERVRTKNALRQRESYQSALLDNFPFLVWLKNKEGLFLAVNQPFASFHGYPDKVALQGKTDFDIWPGNLAKAYRDHDFQVMESGRQSEHEEAVSIGGQHRWFEVYKAPVFDDDGELLGTVGFARDISSRKVMERYLRESEEKYRNLLETAAEGVWLIDEHLRTTEVNDSLCKMLGYSKKEMLGKTPFDFVDAENRAIFAAQTSKISSTRHRTYEITLKKKDGGNLYTTFNATTHYDEEGKVRGGFAFVNDISGRKHAEEVLRFQLVFQKAATEISSSLLGVSESDFTNAINRSLRQLGELFNVDRSYVFRFSEDLNIMTNTHEWCAMGVEPQKGRIQGISTSSLPFFLAEIQKLHPVHIPDVEALPEQAQAERLEFQAQSIKSLVCLPLVGENNALLGFMGFDAVRQKHTWPDEQISMLEVLAGVFSGAFSRRRSEEKLRLAASVFTHAREGIIISDARGIIVDVNDAFTRITGYDREEVLGKNPRLLKSGRQGHEFYAGMWRDLMEKGHWYGEIWNRRKSGEVYAEMLTISPVHFVDGVPQNYVALFSDITALKKHQQQLEHIAHYDALTGLPNRVLLADRMHQAMAQAKRRGQRLIVSYLDLDGFKEINDTFGHEVGDQLLMSIAHRMKEVLREGDTIARLGGDEFVAVLIDLADINASVPLLNRLLEAVARPVVVGGRELQVSASIGAAFYPQLEDVGADQLLRQADQAMYQVKLAGKNRYHFFDMEQDRNVRGHYEALEEFRRALAGNEFVLYYQPKVNMRTGKVAGVEALIRWRHPERGLLFPMEFLPLIENHPLAIELGEWVIETALCQIEAWQTEGLALAVSVNVGARQLQQTDFIDRLRGLMALHPKVMPGLLELEVLETSALEDIAQVSKVMRECREIGVHFALDDFGTGYSSLTYLKRLPASQLKIDMSFVRDMLDDPEDLAILEGVLGLAMAFRRQAIAEGVETERHGEMLLQLGCDLAQGYFIAQPMVSEDLFTWLDQWRPPSAWLMQRRVSRDDLPVLFASVEHRSWLRAIEGYVHGECLAPPPMDHHECRFGGWLDSEGRERYSKHPAFQNIINLHRQVHRLAAELVELHRQGKNPAAKARLPALHGLRDALLVQLKKLI